ncbi:MAG: M20/M25/M40 family metallo-hydrolase [Nocardioides sp.]|uniref:M20/M25/M40 family metallo-hydrolase n=1 Tax=Nocardioides sp. TaxID=35761 RepID=UPI0039E43899
MTTPSTPDAQGTLAPELLATLATSTHNRLATMIDDALGLIGTESPSADLAAVARSADAVADLMVRRLGSAPEIRVIDGVSHVLLVPPEPRVLLLGHHDTVWPVGSLATMPARVENGTMTGPGCFDMLVGVVQAVHALAALVEAGRPEALDRVAVLVTGDEEIGSASSQALIEEIASRCRAALVLEASADNGALKVARKGAGTYSIEVTGRAAHAGLEPERGVNAGLELARLALDVAALGDSTTGTTVTPTTMTAGTTSNTVPAQARLEVDVRAWTRIEQERVHRAITALRPHDPKARVQVRGAEPRPPLERSAAEDLFTRAAALAAALGLEPLAAAEVGGASDGNLTAGVGVPTLDGLGAVGGGAHAADEHVLVAAIPGRTALLAALVAVLSS